MKKEFRYAARDKYTWGSNNLEHVYIYMYFEKPTPEHSDYGGIFYYEYAMEISAKGFFNLTGFGSGAGGSGKFTIKDFIGGMMQSILPAAQAKLQGWLGVVPPQK